MARDFDGVDDIVDCGSAAALDNINTFTYTAHLYADTEGESGSGTVLAKITAGAGKRVFQYFSADVFRILVDRATTDGEARTNDFATGVHQFAAATYDGTDGPRLFRGTPSVAVAEVSYTTRTVGSGAEVSDAAGSLIIGAVDAGGSVAWDGRIADVRLYNVRLTIAELEMVQRGLVPRPDALIGWWPLFGVQSPEPDWSGRNNHGTVTGAVRIDHPPGISIDFSIYRDRRVLVAPAVAAGVGSRRMMVNYGV